MTSLRNVLTAVVLVGLLASYPTAAHRYADWSAWSAPENLGPVVNSSSNDQGPAISEDGLSLYFSSGRPGGSGRSDIWVSQRDSPETPWDDEERVTVQNLGPVVNTGNDDGVPALSGDEHYLFFNRNRPVVVDGEIVFVDTDIWASYRKDTSDDFGWRKPKNLGPGVNSPSDDQGAGYFDNDKRGTPLLFFGRNRLKKPNSSDICADPPDREGCVVANSSDIYVSKLSLRNRTFGRARKVKELSNRYANDFHPSVRSDGLEVFFFSNRSDVPPFSTSTSDLWTATRKTVFNVWSNVKNLGPVNSPANDIHPYIASDQRTLYFASTRTGGSGAQDLYVTTRSRLD